jgi:hypothetical protein
MKGSYLLNNLDSQRIRSTRNDSESAAKRAFLYRVAPASSSLRVRGRRRDKAGKMCVF